MHNKGGMRQEGRKREGQNSGEQRHLEKCGREREGSEEGVEEGKTDMQWSVNYDSYRLIKMILHRITVKMETK